MSRNELEAFLETEESRKGAEQGDEEEHQGRHLARRVIELLEKLGEHRSDPHMYELSLLYEADLQQMHQVAEYIRCHREEVAEKGGKLHENSIERWHLMNCGFDPLKEE